MNKHGQVNWSDVQDSKKADSSEFLRLSPGPNRVRILTLPYQYQQHKLMDGKKFLGRVNCAGDGCAACKLAEEQGGKAKTRWYLGVIERKTGMYKILDVGYALFKLIQNLAQDEENWGPTENYDIVISQDPNAPPISFYSVLPTAKKPMTAEDLAIKDDIKYDELERRVEPPSVEKVAERVDQLFNGGGSKAESDDDMPTSNGSEEKKSFFKNYDEVKTTKRANAF